MEADVHKLPAATMTPRKRAKAGRYRELRATLSRRFIAAARHPYAIVPLALLAATDSVMPLLPAEVMAITLMVVQSQHRLAIGACFTLAAAVSAVILALLVQQAREAILEFNPGLVDDIANSSPLIDGGGAVVLAVLAIFPDSPRASIAAAASLGISPTAIFIAVLAGKTLFYAGLALLLRSLPQLIARPVSSNSAVATKLRSALRRLAAFQRLLRKGDQ